MGAVVTTGLGTVGEAGNVEVEVLGPGVAWGELGPATGMSGDDACAWARDDVAIGGSDGIRVGADRDETLSSSRKKCRGSDFEFGGGTLAAASSNDGPTLLSS